MKRLALYSRFIKHHALALGLGAGVIGAALVVALPLHAQSAPAPQRYVALGDSVAAGAGLPLAANASTEDTICQRSPQAYPTLVAANLGTTVTNLTCSGASVSKGITNAQTVTYNNQSYTVPSQLDRAFANGVPDVITMTIGANDLSFTSGGGSTAWKDVLQKCYTDQCGGAAQSTAIGLSLTRLQARLGLLFRDIKQHSGSHTPPRVLITEYYYPVTSTSCLGGGITDDEANWINYQAYNLNKAIRQTVVAAANAPKLLGGPYDFVTYVPVNFNGHGLCASDSWIQGLSDPAPIHPTATGQATYAAAVTPYAR